MSAIQLIAMHFFLNRPQPNSPAIDTNFGPYIAVMPIGMDSHPLSWLVKRMNTSDVRKSLLTQLPPSVTSALSNLRQRFYEDFDAVCKFVVRA